MREAPINGPYKLVTGVTILHWSISGVMSQLVTGSGSPCRVRFSSESLLQWRLDPSNQSFTHWRGRPRGSSQSRVLWVQNARTGRAGKKTPEKKKNPWRIHGDERYVYLYMNGWHIMLYVYRQLFPKRGTILRTKVGFQNQGSWNGTQFFRGVCGSTSMQTTYGNSLIDFSSKINLSRWWCQISFTFTPKLGDDDPIWRADFSDMLKPPTTCCLGNYWRKNQRPSFMVDPPWDFEGKVVLNPIWIGCSNKAGHGKNVPQAVFSRWILELQAQVPNHGFSMDILGSSPNQDTSHHQDYDMF